MSALARKLGALLGGGKAGEAALPSQQSVGSLRAIWTEPGLDDVRTINESDMKHVAAKVAGALGIQLSAHDSSYWSAFYYTGAATERFTSVALSRNHDPLDDEAIYPAFPTGAFVLDLSYIGRHDDAAACVAKLGEVTVMRQK